MTPGARLVRDALDSPLLEPCWPYEDLLDWDLVELIEDRLSGGEQAVIEVARSIDGQGTCNLFWALAQMDGRCRDLVVRAINTVAGAMLR